MEEDKSSFRVVSNKLMRAFLPAISYYILVLLFVFFLSNLLLHGGISEGFIETWNDIYSILQLALLLAIAAAVWEVVKWQDESTE